jgi:hypothetical protein
MAKVKTENIALRWSPEDKAALRELAQHVSRSQSDTLRQLVRGALAALQTESGQPSQQPKQSQGSRA